jgi:hypothetical protein
VNKEGRRREAGVGRGGKKEVEEYMEKKRDREEEKGGRRGDRERYGVGKVKLSLCLTT